MPAFTKMSNCTKTKDLFDDIFCVIASIESMDDNSDRGSLSQGRKTKPSLEDGRAAQFEQ